MENQKIRFLFLNTTVNQTSTGKILLNFYNFVVSKGHQAVFCYGRNSPTVKKQNFIKLDSNVEVFFHVVLARFTGLQGYFSNFATKKFIKLLNKYKPDVVILGNLHGYYINYHTVLSELKKRNLFTFYYMFDEYAFLGKCGFPDDCDKYLSECDVCPRIKEYPKSFFMDKSSKIFNDKIRLYRDFYKLTFNSVPYTANKAKFSSIMKQSNSIICDYGWGIDISSNFYPKDSIELRNQLNIDSDKVIVLNVGLYSDPRKGIDKFYELANKCNIPKYVFIHIGLDQRVSNCPPNLISIPYLSDQSQLADYYSLSDLFVTTSSGEACPTVCLMALCCGTPISGFNTSGIPFVAPSPLGQYAPLNDIDALLNIVVNTDKKTTKTIIECRQYAENFFDCEKINIKVLDYIQSSLTK